MKPNLFIVGAPKCGTTALAQYLGEHEKVFFSNPKELLYWSDDFKTTLPHEPNINSLLEYENYFINDKPSIEIVAEGSTRYLVSDTAIKNIYGYNKDAKFILILRNPVDVAYAYHMEQVYSLYEKEKDFMTAWRKEINGTVQLEKFRMYSSIGRFGAQLERLFSIVPRKQVKVILFDDFKSDPKCVYDDVLVFLGIPLDGRNTFPRVNASHMHRSKLIATLWLNPPWLLQPLIKYLRNHLLTKNYSVMSYIKKSLNKKKARLPLTKAERKEIYEFYKDDICLLEDILGRKLTAWKEV